MESQETEEVSRKKLRQTSAAEAVPPTNGPMISEASKPNQRAGNKPKGVARTPEAPGQAARSARAIRPAELTTKVQAGELLPVLGPFITPTSLELPETVSYEVLQNVGHALNLTGGAQMWWLGDYLNIAEKRCGEEEYARIIQELDYAAHTLAEAKAVTKAYRPGERRTGVLSWSHHQVVAYLKAPVRKQWLDRAEKERLSRSALRESVREAVRIGAIAVSPHKRGPKVKTGMEAPALEAPAAAVSIAPKRARKPQPRKGESQEAMVGRYLDQLFNATAATIAPAEEYLELAKSAYHKLSAEGNEGLEYSDMEALKAAEAELANALPNIIEPLEALLAQRER